MDLTSFVDHFERAKILIVGDIILDQYIWGGVNGISPEAPIPVVEVIRESVSLGGASNVANNVHALGAQVMLCGVVGEESYGEMLLHHLNEKQISTKGVVLDPNRPTTRKTRIVAHKQQVVRVDRENAGPIGKGIMEKLKDRILDVLPQVDAVVLEDYGKGVIQEQLLQEILPVAKKAGKIVTVDPKDSFFEQYRGITAMTPNRVEAEKVAEIQISDTQSLHEAGNRLRERLQCEAVLITLGEQGMCLVEKGKPPFDIPARAREVFDVSGAGDTVIAVFTMALIAGASFQQAAMLSNIAGSLVVEKLGTATVSREEMKKRLREVSG